MIRLADLEGRWRLDRRIEDRRAGIIGRFEGEAVWHADGAGLRQEETGLLHFGTAPPMQASRVYLWRESETGLEVFFEDGRPFHSLSADRLQDRHWCDPDTYDVTYQLATWPDWHQVWDVTGPRKDMRLTSRFRR